MKTSGEQIVLLLGLTGEQKSGLTGEQKLLQQNWLHARDMTTQTQQIQMYTPSNSKNQTDW